MTLTKLSKRKNKNSSSRRHKPKYQAPSPSKQMRKMRTKASSKRHSSSQVSYKASPVPGPSQQKCKDVLELEKQIRDMQEKIRSIEETQRNLQAASEAKQSCSSASSSSSSSSSQAGPSTSSSSRNSSCRRSSRNVEEEIPCKSSSSKRSKRKRKLDNIDDDDQPERQAQKVAYIHVGEGGERDLEDHLRGSDRVNVQILSTERLPDIDASDMIHGLDSSGTSRDHVDDEHRCNVSCPVGCQGHLRPNEIIIYESIRYDGRLFGRKRIKGRFVTDGSDVDDVVSLDMTDFRRIGGARTRASAAAGARTRRSEAAPTRRTTRRRTAAETGRSRATTTTSSTPPSPGHLGLSTVPRKISILMESPPVSRELAEENTWSSTDKSFNIVIKDGDSMVMRRHPIAQSTDCIRGKTGYSSGVHMFEVTWPVRQRGTHAVLGVATKDAPLHATGYQSLVGNSDQSWGWDLGRVKVFHNNVVQNSGGYYPSSVTQSHQWTVPESIKMVLDMDVGSLGFVIGDQWLGWAVSGLKNSAPLYPVVSTVWGHCEVKLRYLCGLDSDVLSLQDASRSVIRETIGAVSNSLVKNKEDMEAKIDKLPLPVPMKKFVKYL